MVSMADQAKEWVSTLSLTETGQCLCFSRVGKKSKHSFIHIHVTFFIETDISVNILHNSKCLVVCSSSLPCAYFLELFVTLC